MILTEYNGLELIITEKLVPRIPLDTSMLNYVSIADATIDGIIKKDGIKIGTYKFIIGNEFYDKNRKIDSFLSVRIDDKFQGKNYFSQVSELLISYSKNRGAKGFVFSHLIENMDLDRLQRSIEKKFGSYIITKIPDENSIKLEF